VIKQVPNPGAQAKTGSVIRLTLAKPASIEVPKVAGMYLANAKRIVAEAGLTVGRVRRVEHPEKGENYVLRQTPAPGDKVPPATEVELVVVAPN
jgi:serine/threonine-protein kinase